MKASYPVWAVSAALLLLASAATATAQTYTSDPALGVVGTNGSGYRLSCQSIDPAGRQAVLRVLPANGTSFLSDGTVEIHEGGFVIDGQLERGGVVAARAYAAGATGPFDLTVSLGFAGGSRSYYAVRRSPSTGMLDQNQWNGPVVISESSTTVPPSVTNISVRVIEGTKKVEIRYDLADSDSPALTVGLTGSADGGATYALPITTVSGDIGEGISPGSNKAIVWDAGADWPEQFSEQVRFRVNACEPPMDGFSLIPAGSFTMGRTSGDTDSNAPPVSVNVSAFYMGKYEVTKALWDEVRTWGAANGYTDLRVGDGKASNHPVHTISWFDMVKWCNARSQKDGLTPVYTVSGAVMKTGTTAPATNWSANGYRLPTEAEWEKAARGGVSGKRFPWGTDTINDSNANYRANSSAYNYDTSGYTTYTYHPTYAVGSNPYSSPVGSFAPNGYGLYDMAGNMWEWCWDWYGASTYVNGATDPRGAASGTNRVLRGGSWSNRAIHNRATDRYGNDPTYVLNNIGFRMARSSVP
jgi:formylglycine-generating enzyme required for sulfatase activity